LVVIGAIDCLSGTIADISGVPDKFLVTDSKVSIGNPMSPVLDPNI
jgi:hypothetical protein